jgi:glycosyltransferase involved in cell wall biosynthesis
LRLCCDEKIDFNTRNTTLRTEYLEKMRRNNGIMFGRVRRGELIHNVLPRTDIYLLPTYIETFGFAVLEAMAFGIPVISTNHFAIHEMVEHGDCGFLIDTNRFNCEQLFRGYVINEIPTDFREYVTDNVFKYLCQLIESSELRRKLGMAGLNIARTKFSFETRNDNMLEIYREALQ